MDDPLSDEKDISRSGVRIRLTVEFHDFLTSRGSSGEPRRDANSQIEALLWNLDLFTSMMHLYGIFVGSTATTIDWNDIRIASLRERFVSIYDLFLAETNFERKFRLLLDLVKLQIVFAGAVYDCR